MLTKERIEEIMADGFTSRTDEVLDLCRLALLSSGSAPAEQERSIWNEAIEKAQEAVDTQSRGVHGSEVEHHDYNAAIQDSIDAIGQLFISDEPDDVLVGGAEPITEKQDAPCPFEGVDRIGSGGAQ